MGDFRIYAKNVILKNLIEDTSFVYFTFININKWAITFRDTYSEILPSDNQEENEIMFSLLATVGKNPSMLIGPRSHFISKLTLQNGKKQLMKNLIVRKISNLD